MEHNKCPACNSTKLVWTRHKGVRVMTCQNCGKVAIERGSLIDLAFKTANEFAFKCV